MIITELQQLYATHPNVEGMCKLLRMIPSVISIAVACVPLPPHCFHPCWCNGRNVRLSLSSVIWKRRDISTTT